jgi:uncharacterized protein (TIGR02145 family)
LGGDAVAAGKMKVAGTTRWTTPNTGATNESGFAGLPGGLRLNDGTFNVVGNYGYWWSSTEYFTANAWFRYLYYFYANIFRNVTIKQDGLSVRCLRN